MTEFGRPATIKVPFFNLVIGTSLYVFSAFRFINQAKTEGKEIGVINIGQTRADNVIDMKIEAKAGDILSKIII